LMGGLLHLVQRAGDWAGPQLYNGPLLCGFNVAIKGITDHRCACWIKHISRWFPVWLPTR